MPRTSGAARHVIPTSGLVAGSFTHGVNRNLDPHLHTHVVAANLVHGDDGRWSACDQRGLWAHRRAAGAVYDAHLRADLTARLGLEWVGGPGSRAEVRGMSPLLLGEFSSRAADVRRHRAQWGAHSARGTQVAWAATRPAKTAGVAFADLVGQWERRSEALGQGRDDRSALVGRAAVTRPTLDEHRFRAVLSATSDGAARRRDVVEALAVAAVGGAPSPALERLVDLWVPAGPEVGVAERALAPRRVVPGDHLLAALGPRPVDPGDHEVWRAGALAIDAYRRRWGVAADRDVPGVAPEPGLASLPAPRLADHVRTARAVELVRQRLGWREPHRVELERGR